MILKRKYIAPGGTKVILDLFAQELVESITD